MLQWGEQEFAGDGFVVQNIRIVPLSSWTRAGLAFIPEIVKLWTGDQVPPVIVRYRISFLPVIPAYRSVCQATQIVPLLAWRAVGRMLLLAL